MAGMSRLGPAPPGQRYNAQGQLEATPEGQQGSDPVTGAPVGYPNAGVDPSQTYGAATQLKSQGEAEQAQSKLSAQQSQEMMTRSSQQAQLNAEAQARLMGQIPGLMGGLVGAAPTAQYGGPYGTGTGQTPLQAAQAATFARAKDAAGTAGRSALDALRDLYSGSDMIDSGGYLAREGQIVSGASGQIGEANREQMIQELMGQQHAADENLQAQVTQRGQNLGLAGPILGLLQGRAY